MFQGLSDLSTVAERVYTVRGERNELRGLMFRFRVVHVHLVLMLLYVNTFFVKCYFRPCLIADTAVQLRRGEE
jgi:hypothetical protein